MTGAVSTGRQIQAYAAPSAFGGVGLPPATQRCGGNEATTHRGAERGSMNYRTLGLAIASMGVSVYAANGCAQGGETTGGVRDESSVEEEEEADVGLGADSTGDSGDSGDVADQGSDGTSGDQSSATAGSTSGAQGSTSGQSSTGPSSSGSSSGGSSGSCDGSGNCDTCFDCAVQGPCAGPVDACLSNAACAAVDECVFNCDPNNQQCFEQCMQMNGSDMWLQADDCVFCSACPADCMADFCA